MFNRFYGFFSIGIIELGNLFTNFSNLLTCIIIILQIIIAMLTIVKLWKDVRTKKYKNLERTEKDLKKKKPFIFALIELIKKMRI